ncbi:hypothetical protein CBM2585_A60166 [Cupriavidus taiwanensis]|nr:hypothetical protein CBM2585_A60166 [Cupriavidus taiwanensis]
MAAAQEGAGGAELGGLAEAARRVGRGAALRHFLDAQAGLLRAAFHGLEQAVGIERAGQQVVDGDAVLRHFARDAGNEAGQARARAVGQAQHIDRRLDRAAGDVDDAAPLARDHAVDGGLDQLDRGQHVGVERGQPVAALPVAEIARRRAAGVVDQDVEVAEFGGRVQRRLAPFRRGDVGRHRDYAAAMARAQVGRGLFQRLGASRHDHHVDALGRQRIGAGKAQALAGAAYQRMLAAQSQIHVILPSLLCLTDPRGRAHESGFLCRQQVHAAHHQRAAGQLHAAEGLAEQPEGQEQRRYRPDHAGLRGQRRADARHRHHRQRHRQHGAEHRVDERQPHHRRRLRQLRHGPAQHQVLDHAAGGRHAHGIRHQPQRADAPHQLAAQDQVDTIGDGAAQHQRAAQPHLAAADIEVMREHQHDAGIGQQQRQPLARADGATEHQRGGQQHERWRQEQDQPLQPRGDVLQADEVEEARQVVADKAEKHHTAAVGPRQRRQPARLPPANGHEQRHREQHAQRDHHHRIDVVAVHQLGDDGLGREQHRAHGGDDKTRALRRGQRGGHGEGLLGGGHEEYGESEGQRAGTAAPQNDPTIVFEKARGHRTPPRPRGPPVARPSSVYSGSPPATAPASCPSPPTRLPASPPPTMTSPSRWATCCGAPTSAMWRFSSRPSPIRS